jgi:putative ABC transport system ATP-binding protein
VELAVDHLRFHYPHSTFALQIDHLHIAPAECVAVVGPSGCGKSTLLKLLSGILRPTAGRIQVGPHRLTELDDTARRAFRARHLGFVFQDFCLLDYLTVRENILLPGRLNAVVPLDAAMRSRALDLAGQTGLSALLDRSVVRLSQGERQRVALCRALVGSPSLIFADEPTGNLDPDNKQKIFELLLAHARAAAATLIVVTHDHSFLARFDRTLSLRDFLQATA